MSFDAIAAALDWLDAYRAKDIDAILAMYADDAVVECGCGGAKTISGNDGLRAYWVDRLQKYPASELDDLQPSVDGARISYITRAGLVGAVIEFDRNGKIVFLTCGPAGGPP